MIKSPTRLLKKSIISSFFLLALNSCITNTPVAPEAKTEKPVVLNKNIAISLDKSSITFNEPDMSEVVVATITGSTNTNIVWTSEDPYIATVDNNGVVTSVSGGTVKIIATSEEPSDAQAVCEVTINETVRTISENYLDAKSIKDGLVNIIMCGDSTMRTYTPADTDQAGWGQVLQDFFTENAYVINNISMGGRSSRSFYTEDLRWPRIRTILENSDTPTYIFIQFGHNDQKEIANGGGRFLTYARTNPNGTTAGTYYDYLERYIVEARELGAIPVLFTPFVRAYFSGDEISGKGQHNLTSKYKGEPMGRGDYVAAMKEIGEKHNVPVIDLTALTKSFVEEYKADDKLKFVYTMADSTHEKTLGALLMAEAAANSLKEMGILANYIKTPAPRVMIGNSTITFNKVAVGSTKEATLRISSFGDATGTLTITAPEGFQIYTDSVDTTNSITINCDSSWKGEKVYVKFNPTAPGTFGGEITLSHDKIDVDYGNTVPNNKEGVVVLTATAQ